MPLYEAKRVWDLLLTKWIKVVGKFTHLTWKHYTAWKVWRYREELAVIPISFKDPKDQILSAERAKSATLTLSFSVLC
jgi:hypothetical protein